jgi:hypothetical protein
MNPELAKKMLDVISSQDEKAALALLVELAASMASGGEPPAEAPAEGSALADSADAPPAPAPGEEEKKQLSAVVQTVTEMGETIKKLAKIVEGYENDRAAGETEERRGLVAELVKCGSETPATAWSGKPEDRKPAEPWASMPIASLRDRVKALSKSPRLVVVAPPAGDTETIKLSKIEQEYCKKHGLTPEQFAAKKASTVRKAK